MSIQGGTNKKREQTNTLFVERKSPKQHARTITYEKKCYPEPNFRTHNAIPTHAVKSVKPKTPLCTKPQPRDNNPKIIARVTINIITIRRIIITIALLLSFSALSYNYKEGTPKIPPLPATLMYTHTSAKTHRQGTAHTITPLHLR